MGQAVFNMIMGIGTVFIVLLLISGVISCFRYISKIEEHFKKEKNVPMKVTEKIEEVTVAEQDDLELVAVIAAAIAASTGVSTDDFVVRSIIRR